MASTRASRSSSCSGTDLGRQEFSLLCPCCPSCSSTTSRRSESLASWGWRRLTYRPSANDIVANGLLFVPLGFFLTLLTRRPALAFAGSTAGSVAVELVQAVTFLGVPDVSDVIANSSGALAGSLSAMLLLALTPVRREPAYRRSTTILTAAFTDSDAAEYEQWERDDLLDSRVFDRASVRINGNAFPEDTYLGRWPATFLWVDRCVFVQWADDGTTVRDGAGRECAVFMS